VPPVVLPALAPFLRAQPNVQIEIHRSIDRPVIEALAAGRVDVVISQHEADSPGIVDTHIGDEEFVMIESKDHPGRRDVFLDTAPRDDTTAWFLNAQPARNRPTRWTRSFLHDEPGILLGVELGLGRAVKPRHTIPDTARIKIDATFAPISRPVRLQYRRQRYYGRLQRAVVELVDRAVKDRLKKKRAASR
jgi:DNA-binding transcriptional LysR family regulator